MHVGLCLCAVIPTLATRTRVVLVIHRIEDRKTTNTGRLAMACLARGDVVVRGHEGDEPGFPVDEEALETLVLFPHEDAEPLTTDFRTRGPFTLVIPDGNWRQAAKVRARLPGLTHARAVSLPEGPPSRYRLRWESDDRRLSTIEATARALGILEGDATEQAMMRIFDAMVERSLWVKGIVDAVDVTGGLPASAERHDPVSGLTFRGPLPLELPGSSALVGADREAS